MKQELKNRTKRTVALSEKLENEFSNDTAFRLYQNNHVVLFSKRKGLQILGKSPIITIKASNLENLYKVLQVHFGDDKE